MVKKKTHPVSIRDDWSIKLGEHVVCDGEALEEDSYLIISHAHGDHYRENKVLNSWRRKKPLIVTDPGILKTDIISKLNRLTTGDICEITRESLKCGEYLFYRVCK